MKWRESLPGKSSRTKSKIHTESMLGHTFYREALRCGDLWTRAGVWIRCPHPQRLDGIQGQHWYFAVGLANALQEESYPARARNPDDVKQSDIEFLQWNKNTYRPDRKSSSRVTKRKEPTVRLIASAIFSPNRCNAPPGMSFTAGWLGQRYVEPRGRCLPLATWSSSRDMGTLVNGRVEAEHGT